MNRIARLLSLVALLSLPTLAATVHTSNFGCAGNGSSDDTTCFQNAVNAAGSGGTVIVDQPSVSFLINGTSAGGNCGISAAISLPNGVTITSSAIFGPGPGAPAGAPILTNNNSSTHYFFCSKADNVHITGLVFNGTFAVAMNGNANANATINNFLFQHNTVQNVTSTIPNDGGSGSQVWGIMNQGDISYNVYFQLWAGGYTTNQSVLFPSGCPNINGGEACDSTGTAIAVQYMNHSTVTYNKASEIGGDVFAMDGAGIMYQSIEPPDGGYSTVAFNDLSLYKRFGIEINSGGAGGENYNIIPYHNLTVEGNYVHNPAYVWWLIDGYSIVPDGVWNLQFINNTAANDNATLCFGGNAGDGVEYSGNTITFTGNVISSVSDACSGAKGWIAPFLMGNGKFQTIGTTGNGSLQQNNVSCGPGGSQPQAFDDGTVLGGSGSGPSDPGHAIITSNANAYSETCASPNISTPNAAISFTSPNNQSIPSGSGTWNVSVTSILSLRYVSFYVDGNTTAALVQDIQDFNPNFGVGNAAWLYHATLSTTGLTSGGHTISAVVTDVSGATATATQNFTVGGTVVCTIPSATLPQGTVGTLYKNAGNPVTIASSGCSTGTWAVNSGTLPAGLSLTNATTSTVTISGTPTTVSSSSFTLRYAGTVSPTYQIVVTAASSCSTGTNPAPNSGLYSDPFTENCIAPIWALMPGLHPGTAAVGSSGLVLNVPADPSGSGNDAYQTGDNATVLTQSLQGNSDFTATAKFTSVPNTANQSEGIQAIQDNFNFIRCEALIGPGTLQGLVLILTGNSGGATPNFIYEDTYTPGTSAPLTLQLSRVGNSYTCNAASGTGPLIQLGAFTSGLAITKVGITADNSGPNGDVNAPAWSVVATSFTISGSSVSNGPPNTATAWGQTPFTLNAGAGTITMGSNFVPTNQSITMIPTGVTGTFALVSPSVGTVTNVAGSWFYSAPATVNPQHARAGCMVGPNDSIFNTRVDGLSLAALSSQWTDDTTIHTIDGQPLTPASAVAFTFQPPFGLNVVDNSLPGSTMTYFYTTAYNGTKIQIPTGPGIREGGWYVSNGNHDHHMETLNHETCNWQETYQNGVANGSCPLCTAQSGWQYLATQYTMPLTTAGGGTTNAAGMPLTSLGLHLDEMKKGAINHALLATTSPGYITNASFQWPATTPNGGDNTFSAPFGARFRLKASVNPAGLNPMAQAIITALKQYGFFFTDSGSPNAFIIDSDVSLDPAAVTAIQQLTAILHITDFEVPNESSLQVAATSTEVPVASATGSAVQITFTPSVGSPVTFPLALQAITVGTPYDTASIMAGESPWQVPFWVNGDPTNSSATWAVSSCSAGAGLCGTITAAGVYTPPASVTAGTFLTATLTGTAVSDTAQTKNLYIKVFPSGNMYVDSGGAVPFTDVSFNVWTPDANALQIENYIYPWFTDLFDPLHLWQQGYAAGVPNIGLWQTGVGGEGGTSGSGDILFAPIILNNGSYDLRLLFGLTSQNNGSSACWGSYTANPAGPNYFAIGPLTIATQGTIQAHNWDYGIPAHHQCRTPITLDVPLVVSNRVGRAIIGTDPSGFDETFLNAYSVFPINGSPTWTIDSQQQSSVAQGNSLQLFVQNWTSGITDPLWKIVSGPGAINSNGVYTTPGTVPFQTKVTIQAVSSSNPAIQSTTTLVVSGNKIFPIAIRPSSQPAISLSPSALAFGTVATGTTSTGQIITISNTGAAALAIGAISISGTNSSVFSDVSTCGSSLAVNANCQVTVKFSPAAAIAYSASLIINSNAPTSPTTVAMTGTGTNPVGIDIRTFGVNCNGSDDRIALQSGLDGLANGATVIFSCTASVSNPGVSLVNKTGVTVTASNGGGLTALGNDPNTTWNVLQVTNCTGCMIENLLVDSSSLPAYGIHFNRNTNTTFQFNTVQHVAWPAACAFCTINDVANTNGKYFNNSVLHTGQGPPGSFNGVRGFWIGQNNSFLEHSPDIEFNECSDNGHTCYAVIADQAIIRNNVAENLNTGGAGCGIKIGGDAGQSQNPQYVENNIVRNSSNPGATDCGIQVEMGANSTVPIFIRNNTLTNLTGSGLYLGEPNFSEDNLTVSGNTLIDTGQTHPFSVTIYGRYGVSGGAQLMFTGNTIMRSTHNSGPLMLDGVDGNSGTSGIQITGNSFTGGTTDGVRFQSGSQPISGITIGTNKFVNNANWGINIDNNSNITGVSVPTSNCYSGNGSGSINDGRGILPAPAQSGSCP